MTLKETLNQDYKEAMRNKDVEVKNTLRLVLAAIKQVEVDEQKVLDEGETLKVVQKEAKSLKETIADAEKVDNQNLIDEANGRLEILEKYLPKGLSPMEVDRIVKEVIEETGASSMADMGSVMKVVMARVAGLADGKTVSTIVRDNLS